MNKQLIALVKELLEMDELHQKYQDNNISFAIDTQKVDDSTLNITIKLLDNIKDDKEEFENWLKNVPQDIFAEAIESLDENINEKYNSEDYKEIIDSVRNRINSIINDRLATYSALMNC